MLLQVGVVTLVKWNLNNDRLVDFCLIPMGTKEVSVAEYIAKVRMLRAQVSKGADSDARSVPHLQPTAFDLATVSSNPRCFRPEI